ncbi:MAG: hypothetical protein PHW04_12525 [Candidatus Wallbacteria bacterium]|nr:hypothetical protein [Candidatus Wallbacteria bacterium]
MKSLDLGGKYEKKILITALIFICSLQAADSGTAAPCPGNRSPGQAKLVYSSGNMGYADDDIFIMNDDGSDLKQLTNTTYLEEGGSLSSDQKMVFYTKDLDGNSVPDGDKEIYRLDLQSGLEKKVTDLKASAIHWPSLSPDNSLILFVMVVKEIQDLYICDLSGENIHRITNNQEREDCPSFFPDGKRILFIEYSDPKTLVMMNLDGSDKTVLSCLEDEADNAAVSQDGTKVAYIFRRKTEEDFRSRGIKLIDLSDRRVKQVIHCDDTWGIAINGDRIFFSGSLSSSYFPDEVRDEIFSIKFDGTELKRLTNNKTWKFLRDVK